MQSDATGPVNRRESNDHSVSETALAAQVSSPILGQAVPVEATPSLNAVIDIDMAQEPLPKSDNERHTETHEDNKGSHKHHEIRTKAYDKAKPQLVLKTKPLNTRELSEMKNLHNDEKTLSADEKVKE